MPLSKIQGQVVPNLGRRNMIINGDMKIAQRATTTTGQGYQTVDRWKTNFQGPAVTTTQHTLSSSDTPYSHGFRKSLQFHVTDPQTPDAAVDYGEIETRIEAQDVATSGWNYTSASSKITLSFWVLSTVAGTYSVYIRSLDTSTSSNGAYSFDYTVSANTWKKVTHTLPGHANLVFNDDNDVGLVMYFTVYYGTNYTGTVTDDTWRAHVSGGQVGDYAQNILATDESKFEITGVQLEVNDTASDFEHRSFAEELALCQRYLYQITEASASTPVHLVGYNQAGGACRYGLHQQMRAAPAVTTSNMQIFHGTGGTVNITSIDNLKSQGGLTGFRANPASAVSAGDAVAFYTNGTNAYIRFDSEL